MTDNKSYWIKSGTYTLLQRVATTLFAVGILAMLTRVMDKEAYGTYVLFQAVTSLIEVARNGLIQNALIKFGANCSEEEYPIILNASLTLNVILSLVSIGILWFIAPWLAYEWNSQELVPMLHIYCIVVLLLIPFSQFNFLQQARLDFKGIFWTTVVRQGLLFGLVSWFVVFDINIGLIELAWWQVITSGAASALSYLFVFRYLKISKSIHWDWVGKLFHFGKYVFGTNLSSMIFTSIDSYMLGALMTKSTVATYGIAIRIVNLVDIPISTVVAVVFPQSARIANGDKQQIKLLYEKSTGFMLALILPIIFFVCLVPEIIIYLLVGDKYLDAANITRIMVFSMVIQPFIRQFGTMLDSTGKPEVNFYCIMGVALLNAVLNYILIKAIGFYGAALATLTSMVVFALIARWILGKSFDIRFRPTLHYLIQFYQDGGRFISQQFSMIGKSK